MKRDVKRYTPGFIVIFILTFIAMVVAKQKFIAYWGIPYVLWALAFGLVISNFFGDTVISQVHPEYFSAVTTECLFFHKYSLSIIQNYPIFLMNSQWGFLPHAIVFDSISVAQGCQ